MLSRITLLLHLPQNLLSQPFWNAHQSWILPQSSARIRECQQKRNPRRGEATKKVPKERRMKASKNEPAGSETSAFVQESSREPENVAPVEQKPRRGAALRRARSWKNYDELSVSVSVSEVPNVTESSNLFKESCRELGNEVHVEDQTGKVAREGIGASRDDIVARASIPVDGVQLGGSNSPKDASKEPVISSGVKENPVKVDYGKGLEKMTLGEWLDYLEVYLSKQICDDTEEIILVMRERDKRFNELMSQHQNWKGKAKQPAV